ncbi:MAG: hypothetical protein JXR63_06645, partial [Spirochaetales bacterium]|nr:hypothetical protein [Spirochaetales bacterium]
SEADLESAVWQYQAEGSNTWEDYNSGIDLLGIKSYTTNYIVDSANEFVFYYYKVFSVASEVNPKIDEEALIDAGYNLSNGKVITGFLMPNNIDSWLSVSNRDNSKQGQIVLTITVPDNFRPQLANLSFKISRTYRYGGGHRGFNATDYLPAGERDLTSHVSLTNPNPATAQFEKTIFLDYDLSPASFSDGVKNIYDNLYDVDSNGEKLYAVWNTDIVNEGWVDSDWYYANEGYFWYERSESRIASSSSLYEKVKNPDGSDAGMEWHYIKWDWVVRKFLQNTSNPRYSQFNESQKFDRFDFNEAVGCDYKLYVSYNGLDNLEPVATESKRGYPALTPREFTYLSMFLRELAFYRAPAAYYDRIKGLGLGDAGMLGADVTANGYKSGRILVRNGGLNGVSGARADVYTEDLNGSIGYSDLPGCGVKFNWPRMDIKFGDYAELCLSNRIVNVYTPLYSGTISITAYMYAGTYYHGLQEGSRLVVNYTGSDVEVDYRYANEYLGGPWVRAQDPNFSPHKFFDRTTSINWTGPSGTTYPGFK